MLINLIVIAEHVCPHCSTTKVSTTNQNKGKIGGQNTDRTCTGM